MKPTTVEEYFATLTDEQHSALTKLRKIITDSIPDGAVEVISYGMPAIKYKGMLVYYSAFKNHYSLFPGSKGTLGKFAAEMEPYIASVGTLQFKYNKPLPVTLIKKIVKERIKENEAKELAKLAKKKSK